MWCAAAGLEVVRPIVAQSDGGVAAPPGFEHVSGETLFFSCRVAGYAKTPEEKVHLAYSVQAFDPKGVPLTEIYKNEMMTDVTPQDKEWMPKIATEIQIPPLVGAGTYKILVKVEDLVAKANAELSVPFLVRSKTVEPSDTPDGAEFPVLPRRGGHPSRCQKAVYQRRRCGVGQVRHHRLQVRREESRST